MPNPSNAARFVAVLSLCVVIVSNSGCEKYNPLGGRLASGANLKPTVKYKPSTADGPAVESSSASGAAADVASSAGVGTLKGKVEYAGTFSPLPPLYAKGGDVKDAAVCAAVEAPNETILVKDGGLANAFIYLRKAPKASGEVPGEVKVIFDQKNCVFKPHAMLIRVGQTVSVLNSDAVAHNTHTNTVKNTGFNKIVNPNDTVGAPLLYKQAEQEPISVVCDIHSWMRAYHLPIDHPFAAISDEDGTFEIKDLPAGKHEFKVWHEAGGLLEKALVVTIKPGENDLLTIKVSPSRLGK